MSDKKTESQHESFKQWLSSMPHDFPEIFEHDNFYHNPVIQDQQEYTFKAIREGLKFLEEIALPWPGNENFSLGEDATWGYIRFLQCLSGAIEFECKHRDKGGFEVSDEELNGG